MKTTLLGLSLPFLLLAPQDPQTLTLVYKNGESASGQVVSVVGEDVTLKVFIMGGSMQIKRKLAEFQPLSAFRIEQAAKKAQDFDAHFALAKRAVELGVIPQAGHHARMAIESIKDPAAAEAKKTEVRRWAADALEKLLLEAIANSRSADAQHYLKLLSTRLSDQRTEEQLDALAASVEALTNANHSKQPADAQAKGDAKAREAMQADLKPIHKRIEEGDKALREAVRKSRTTVASTNLCEKAIDAYKAAWKGVQALVEKNPGDADLARFAETTGARLHDSAIRAGLHAANMLTVQSNYKGALDWTGRILAFDPDNTEAKEMVKTIQIAQAAAGNQWGWGWAPLPKDDPTKN